MTLFPSTIVQHQGHIHHSLIHIYICIPNAMELETLNKNTCRRNHAFIPSTGLLLTQLAVTGPLPFLRSVFTAFPITAISVVSSLVRLV